MEEDAERKQSELRLFLLELDIVTVLVACKKVKQGQVLV
jgi:hypothetical protein